MGLNESYDSLMESESKAKNLSAIAIIIVGVMCVLAGFFLEDGYFDLAPEKIKLILFIGGGILIFIGILTQLLQPKADTFDY